MNMPNRASRHHFMRASRCSLVSGSSVAARVIDVKAGAKAQIKISRKWIGRVISVSSVFVDSDGRQTYVRFGFFARTTNEDFGSAEDDAGGGVFRGAGICGRSG